MKCRFFALPAILALMLVGCGKPPKPFGGDLPPLMHLRVVSLSPNITELVNLVNADMKLVGRTSGCDYPETPQLQATPIVANPYPNVEKILSSQADLILVDENLINSSYLKKFEDAKIKTEVIRINSLKEWIAAVETIGNLLLAQRAASDAIDELKSAMHLGETDPVSPMPKVMVLMGADKPMAVGTNSFLADAVKAAGGKVVGPHGPIFVPINSEQIMSWDPDIIFVPGDAAPYQKSALLTTRPGGGKRPIVGVNENFLLRAGARVKDLIRGVHNELISNSQK